MTLRMVRLSIRFSIKTNTADRESIVCQQKARFESLIVCENWRFALSSEYLIFNNEIKVNAIIADEFEIDEEEMAALFTKPNT